MSGNMKIRAKEPAIEIIRRMGIVRPVDLEIFGITRARLYSLVQKGLVERRGRGSMSHATMLSPPNMPLPKPPNWFQAVSSVC